jgi:hypothetical protein
MIIKGGQFDREMTGANALILDFLIVRFENEIFCDGGLRTIHKFENSRKYLAIANAEVNAGEIAFNTCTEFSPFSTTKSISS